MGQVVPIAFFSGEIERVFGLHVLQLSANILVAATERRVPDWTWTFFEIKLGKGALPGSIA